MTDAPVDAIDVAAYTVPTDAPEADGTLSWDSTTMVLVTARSGGTSGLGWTYGPAACATIITGKLAGVVRGRDAMDVAGAFDAMVKAVRNAGRPGAVGIACQIRGGNMPRIGARLPRSARSPGRRPWRTRMPLLLPAAPQLRLALPAHHRPIRREPAPMAGHLGG